MKILFITSILLLISTLAMIGTSFSIAIFQAGLVLLLGAFVIYIIETRLSSKKFFTWKIIGIISLCLMIFLTIWGFITGIWNWHPLGFVISLIGCGWVLYEIVKNKKLLIDANKVNHYEQSNKLKYVGWISVPICVLLGLWIFQSIWFPFVVGLMVALILDWQVVKARGINRIVAILILYLIGFFFLLLILTKIQYEMWLGDIEFLNGHTYRYLRDMIRY